MSAFKLSAIRHIEAECLRNVSPEDVRLARTAFDTRLPRWLGTLLNEPFSPAALGPSAPDLVDVTLAFDGGCISVAADGRAWPALRLIGSLEDPSLACDAAEAFFSAPIRRLQARFPGLRVQTIELRKNRCERPAVHLHAGTWKAMLTAVDEGAAATVSEALRDTARAGKRHFGALSLHGRACLFVREINSADLSSLLPGDVVVWNATDAGAKRLPSRLIFGLGTTMQATAEIDSASSTVTLTEPLRAVDTTAAAAQESVPDLEGLGDLGLPVSFEIDTARVTLEELASLAAGSVLALEAPLRDAPVRIVCFGQVVGLGALVAVGDRLGVRVSRMGVRRGEEPFGAVAGADVPIEPIGQA